VVAQQKQLPVRFLIPSGVTIAGTKFLPWRIYFLPEKMLKMLCLEYEVLEPGPLKVGNRLGKLIRAVGFDLGGGGCCSGCTQTQILLDHCSPEWIQEHMGDIIIEIQKNAKDKVGIPVPRRIIKQALKFAILLERRDLKAKYKKMTGKDK